MNKMQCSVETCDQKAETLGYCQMHYRRFHLYGDPNFVKRVQRKPGADSQVRLVEDYAEVELTQGKWAKIDLEDVDRVKQHNWKYSATTGYAYSDKLGEALHQFLIGKAPFGHEIDHGNRDKLDCRKNNIAIVSQSVNAYNKAQTDNAQHISYHSPSGKWQAYITMGKSDQVYLGLYETKELAKIAQFNGRKLWVDCNFDRAKFKPAWKLMRLMKADTEKRDE